MKKVIALDYDKELLPSVGDSMCYDSGFVAIAAEVFDGPNKYDVEIRAIGHVKVFYEGNVYKCASNMPDELLKMFRDGSINTELGDEVDIVENNWWETFVYKNGRFVESLFFEGEPNDFPNDRDIEDYVLDILEPYFKED